jgi:hypothetical protein
LPHWPPLPQEIFVINDDITVEKPIEDYYGELDKRLQGLKSQLGSDADWMPSTYEKYMTGQHQVAGSLQRNVREYYNDFKLLRADTQVYYPVPNEVYRDEWEDVQVTDPMEFTHCRYTPVVTEDARDFGVDGYTLRLQRMDRKIKLFICVTLYNEDYDELRKTLVGICDVSAAGGCAWRPGTGGPRGLPTRRGWASPRAETSICLHARLQLHCCPPPPTPCPGWCFSEQPTRPLRPYVCCWGGAFPPSSPLP